MKAHSIASTAAAAVLKRAANIRLIIFDVDGVFTDGRITLNANGQEIKSFHVRDGHGVKLILHYGIQAAVLSGRTSTLVEQRMRELGITEILQGHQDKATAFNQLRERCGLHLDQICFVGDDIVDVEVMHQVGLAIAVADAHEWTKQHAHWITPSRGGRGAVRECCELILHAQGLLDQALQHTLRC